MSTLTFHVHLLQPLLVTQVDAGEENSSTALDFIPGSVLRGAVIERYLHEHPVADMSMDSTCRRLFLDGAVRYLNIYPLNRHGQRMLPRPLSWRVSKDDRDNPFATIHDFAVKQNPSIDSPTLPSGTFCTRYEDHVELSDPDRYVALHTASEERGVKRKGRSTVYRYEAIAADQRFGGAILAESEEDLHTLRLLLEGAEVHLGGSRSAGYGRVRFENVKIETNWQEYDQDGESAGEGIVIVTLLSDAILRDRNGQLTTDLDALLGWHRQRAYRRTRVVGGFNRRWGLPLTQVPALQAGSVFVYRASEVDRQVLERLRQEGIGERQSEGFGRMAVNWHMRNTFQRRSVDKPVAATRVPSLSGESLALAQRMVERRLRAVLNQKLVAALSQLTMSCPPQTAQLSRLRLAVRRAWREHDCSLILRHLKNLKKGAREQFERARIDGKQLLAWIEEGIQNDSLWETWLEPGEPVVLGGVTAQPTRAIKAEYTLRLLDGLLRKATRQGESGGEAV